MLTNFFVRTTNRYSAYKILAVIDSHKLIPTKVSKQCQSTKKKLSAGLRRSFSSSLVYVSMSDLKQTKNLTQKCNCHRNRGALSKCHSTFKLQILT